MITEPPPSYESVFGQVRAAKQDSSSVPDFFKKFIVIVLGTCKLIHDIARKFYSSYKLAAN